MRDPNSNHVNSLCVSLIGEYEELVDLWLDQKILIGHLEDEVARLEDELRDANV